MYPNKSLTMDKTPDIPSELMRHFIRGYFDGDGSIILSHNTSYYRRENNVKKYIYPTYCFLLLGTHIFLEKIIENLPKLHYSILPTKTKEIKTLRVCAKCDFDILYSFLYNDSTIFLNRKHLKWLEIKSAFMK